MIKRLSAARSRMTVERLQELLARRTVELAALNRKLQRALIQRKNGAAAFKSRGEKQAQRLTNYSQTNKGLRQLMRQMLGAREQERKMISYELDEKTAQTLFGISTRLLSFRREIRTQAKTLKHEISSTQEWARKWGRSARRSARRHTNK